MKPHFMVVVAVLVLVGPWTASAFAQPGGVGVAGSGTLVIKPLAEKKVAELPAGPLFWRVESFATLTQAQAAAGPMGLVAQSGGKIWLFTLGPAGPSGSITPVHSHPGAEAAYVVAGEQTFRTPHAVMRVGTGKAEAGHAATPMQVSSSGSVDLHALVMFVLDATKPFSTPAKFP